jgi:hypothetical protein
MTDTAEKYHGGCLCGTVRYTILGAPTYAAHCHCRDCQRAIGASFVTWIGAKYKDFEVTEGEITYCNTSPGSQRGFCGRCGSSLTGGGDLWNEIGITAASLDDPAIARPTSNVYLDHQQPWVKLDDNLKKFQKFPFS